MATQANTTHHDAPGGTLAKSAILTPTKSSTPARKAIAPVAVAVVLALLPVPTGLPQHPARRSIRVFISCRHDLAQSSRWPAADIFGAVDTLHTALPVRRCSPGSRLGTKLPFKSHNSTRPPQTPAASS
jgi:hypothetical protein